MSTIREQITDFLRMDAERGERSWIGLGGALVWNVHTHLGREVVAYPSVAHARRAVPALNRDAAKAKPGDVHYFAQHPYKIDPDSENAAVEILGGGEEILVATHREIGHRAGDGLRICSVEAYVGNGTMAYMGWAPVYGAPCWPLALQLAGVDREREDRLAFLEQLAARGVVLAKYGEGTVGLPDWNEDSTWRRGHPERLYPLTPEPSELVLSTLGVDLAALDDERERMVRLQQFLSDLS